MFTEESCVRTLPTCKHSSYKGVSLRYRMLYFVRVLQQEGQPQFVLIELSIIIKTLYDSVVGAWAIAIKIVYMKNYSFIASFEKIWGHIKDKGIGNCSLHGAIVKSSSKYFLSYCLTKSVFCSLCSLVILNLSEYSDGPL